MTIKINKIYHSVNNWIVLFIFSFNNNKSIFKFTEIPLCLFLFYFFPKCIAVSSSEVRILLFSWPKTGVRLSNFKIPFFSIEIRYHTYSKYSTLRSPFFVFSMFFVFLVHLLPYIHGGSKCFSSPLFWFVCKLDCLSEGSRMAAKNLIFKNPSRAYSKGAGQTYSQLIHCRNGSCHCHYYTKRDENETDSLVDLCHTHCTNTVNYSEERLESLSFCSSMKSQLCPNYPETKNIFRL